MQRNKSPAPMLRTPIGITAASFPVIPQYLDTGIKNLTQLGFPVQLDEFAYGKSGLFSANDKNRALSLQNLAQDPQIGAIWCARGGYGLSRILPLLDQLRFCESLRKKPKLIFGFSDATALHFYVHQKTALPTVHAPMPGTGLWQKQWSHTKKILLPILEGKLGIGKNSHTLEWKTKIFRAPAKNIEGVLVGGNLTLLIQLIGTPWQPDLRDKILFLEDCGERPYRVDRMFIHLRNSGLLKGLRAVLLGDFFADVAYTNPNEKKHWPRVLTETFADLGIPVIGNLPVGHGPRNELLPLGIEYGVNRAGKIQILRQPWPSK